MQLLGSKPRTVQSLYRKTDTGVDLHTSVQMQYPGGAVAQFFCGMDAQGNDYMQVFGTKGYIIMPVCWPPSSFTLCLKGQPDQLLTVGDLRLPHFLLQQKSSYVPEAFPFKS
ncbi:MAG: hypothetical protein IJZ74_03690 [Clostridia bacterium]|nr:hypothetical protein [Clostridia bacterium]